MVSSTKIEDSISLFDQSKSDRDAPETLILMSIGPVEFSMRANEICDEPCPITRLTGDEETVSQPMEFLISKVASISLASLEPKLSTLAVIKNCSLGLGTGGSVLTAPSLNDKSTPWGLSSTGNSAVCSLSPSFISSISFVGSKDTVSERSPRLRGFQYRTISTMSPLPILGMTTSSFLAPFSLR